MATQSQARPKPTPQPLYSPRAAWRRMDAVPIASPGRALPEPSAVLSIARSPGTRTRSAVNSASYSSTTLPSLRGAQRHTWGHHQRIPSVPRHRVPHGRGCASTHLTRVTSSRRKPGRGAKSGVTCAGALSAVRGAPAQPHGPVPRSPSG